GCASVLNVCVFHYQKPIFSLSIVLLTTLFSFLSPQYLENPFHFVSLVISRAFLRTKSNIFRERRRLSSNSATQIKRDFSAAEMVAQIHHFVNANLGFTINPAEIVATGKFSEVFSGRLSSRNIPVKLRRARDKVGRMIEADDRMLSLLCDTRGIVQSMGTSEMDGVKYVITEKDDGTLEEFFNNNNNYMPTNVIIDMIEDMSHALEAFLESKIVHCNINPENILVFDRDNRMPSKDRPFEFKLSDFQLATVVEDMGEPYFPVSGSLYYMIPQLTALYANRSWYPSLAAESIDHWSLGVCLYYTTTGELPFRPEVETMESMRELLRKRPIDAIAHREGKYQTEMTTERHDRQFIFTLSRLIQLLFSQAARAEIIKEMRKFAIFRTK
ncbi:hypothetical protein PFISCL1PPCAC_10927, partial [Pristionchus fissidentatus]